MKDWDDARLVRQTLTGDNSAFDLLVGRYRSAVFGWVRQTLPDIQHDQDLAQEVFIEAYFSLDTLRDPRKFRGWLRQIARNVCISWLRCQRRVVSYESLTLDDKAQAEIQFIGSRSISTPEALLMEQETFNELKSHLNCLSEVNQKLVRFYYFEGLSYREISKSLGISESAIKSRLHRAREKLKGRQNDG